jgi:hypothetical protein
VHETQARGASDAGFLVLEKAPDGARINLVAQESRRWKMIFSASSLSRFLAMGHVSQEGSQGEPGGFTAFTFHPRSPFSKGTATESMIQGKGRVREFFDRDPDDENVRFHQTKEFLVPKSENELKIVLQTWHDLLELLTVKGSIALGGPGLILEQFEDHWEVIQEMPHPVPALDSLYSSHQTISYESSLRLAPKWLMSTKPRLANETSFGIKRQNASKDSKTASHRQWSSPTACAKHKPRRKEKMDRLQRRRKLRKRQPRLQ